MALTHQHPKGPRRDRRRWLRRRGHGVTRSATTTRLSPAEFARHRARDPEAVLRHRFPQPDDQPTEEVPSAAAAGG